MTTYISNNELVDKWLDAAAEQFAADGAAKYARENGFARHAITGSEADQSMKAERRTRFFVDLYASPAPDDFVASVAEEATAQIIIVVEFGNGGGISTFLAADSARPQVGK